MQMQTDALDQYPKRRNHGQYVSQIQRNNPHNIAYLCSLGRVNQAAMSTATTVLWNYDESHTKRDDRCEENKRLVINHLQSLCRGYVHSFLGTSSCWTTAYHEINEGVEGRCGTSLEVLFAGIAMHVGCVGKENMTTSNPNC
jgi:hypothetical protein